MPQKFDVLQDRIRIITKILDVLPKDHPQRIIEQKQLDEALRQLRGRGN